ncbi:tRNA adenosine(34) deaminase TadA [Haliangium ochraceum]|nr:tRNA adenosine(34) deaminase TadA [Haliangium ochraceum]
MSERDEEFMAAALEEARLAGDAGDVPVGAVIVCDGEIIARGRNRRQLDKDPTAHAEVEALRSASRSLGNWRVEGTLYVTQEPCPMCAGALVNARVQRLVYGCPNPKAGSVHTLYRLVSDARLNHRIEVRGGVSAQACTGLLKSFFAALRRERSRR